MPGQAAASGPDYTGVSTEDLAQAIEREIASGRITREFLVRALEDQGGGDACRKITRILRRECQLTALALADRILTVLCPERSVTIHDLAVFPLRLRGAAKLMASDEWWLANGDGCVDLIWVAQRSIALEKARDEHLGNRLT